MRALKKLVLKLAYDSGLSNVINFSFYVISSVIKSRIREIIISCEA